MESNVSALIATADIGDRSAATALFAALYSELHRLAQRELARHGAAGRIGATTLLHEAYLDMTSHAGNVFPDRARFMSYASRVMRGLIIDQARSRCAIKRGGEFEFTGLRTDVAEQVVDADELTAISDALDALAASESSLAEIVDLKFFCGFSLAEIAGMQGVSERTVQRQWEKARIYLHRTLSGAPL